MKRPVLEEEQRVLTALTTMKSQPAMIAVVLLLNKRDAQAVTPRLRTNVVVSHFLSHTACLKSTRSAANETVIGMTAILGYARVSTTGQDLDAQLAALTAAGPRSGPCVHRQAVRLSENRTGGPGRRARLRPPGDTVVMAAIDRLGRSVGEVTRTIADLGDRRITLRALRESIDTATPTGRAIAAIMANPRRTRTRAWS
jgi:hypothetical protein